MMGSVLGILREEPEIFIEKKKDQHLKEVGLSRQQVEEALEGALGRGGSEMIYTFIGYMGVERGQIPLKLRQLRSVLRRVLGLGADVHHLDRSLGRNPVDLPPDVGVHHQIARHQDTAAPEIFQKDTQFLRCHRLPPRRRPSRAGPIRSRMARTNKGTMIS